jgi:hypothetical protein
MGNLATSIFRVTCFERSPHTGLCHSLDLIARGQDIVRDISLACAVNLKLELEPSPVTVKSVADVKCDVGKLWLGSNAQIL